MNGACPAIVVAAPSTDDLEALPTTDEVLKAVIDGLKTGGWAREQATDFVLDVRKDRVPIQDEVPPTEPVEWATIIVVFDQSQATFTYGFNGPFRLSMEGIHDAFSELDLYVDAVPAPSATLTDQ